MWSVQVMDTSKYSASSGTIIFSNLETNNITHNIYSTGYIYLPRSSNNLFMQSSIYVANKKKTSTHGCAINNCPLKKGSSPYFSLCSSMR
jgi:hypothetical protein